ncbi:MAG: hypothetical protein JSU07_11105 [Bacteroidetes bacterium]|nr:hypothetical protein [Bacteroidota bacterium]
MENKNEHNFNKWLDNKNAVDAFEEEAKDGFALLSKQGAVNLKQELDKKVQYLFENKKHINKKYYYAAAIVFLIVFSSILFYFLQNNFNVSSTQLSVNEPVQKNEKAEASSIINPTQQISGDVRALEPNTKKTVVERKTAPAKTQSKQSDNVLSDEKNNEEKFSNKEMPSESKLKTMSLEEDAAADKKDESASGAMPAAASPINSKNALQLKESREKKSIFTTKTSSNAVYQKGEMELKKDLDNYLSLINIKGKIECDLIIENDKVKFVENISQKLLPNIENEFINKLKMLGNFTCNTKTQQNCTYHLSYFFDK